MKTNWKIALNLILLFGISSCIKNTAPSPTPGEIPIFSLRENLDTLQDEANSWKSDAYFAWADISIRLLYPENSRVIAAAFISPSSEFESLLVYWTLDAKLVTEVVKHEIPVYLQSPITQNDWKIDSQEALNFMLDQEGLEFLRNKGNKQCSFLKLERLRDKPEQPVAWRLTLTECFGDYVRHIILDPITGEILDDS